MALVEEGVLSLGGKIFRADLTLAQKIIILPTLGLLVGVVVFSFLGMQAVNQATDTMLQERMTTAHLVADYLDESLARAFAELKETAGSMQAGPTSSPQTKIENLRDVYSGLSLQTYGIFVWDVNGMVTWSTSDEAVPRYDFAQYPVIEKAIMEGQGGISGLVSAPNSDKPLILLVTPIQEGKTVLVAAVDIAQSSIGGFIKPITLGHTGYAEIIDQAGIVIARTEPGPKPSPFERSDHSGRFATLIADGKPTQGLCHSCHERTEKVEARDVLAFVPLSKVHWGVVIRQSEDEALAPIRSLTQNLIFFGVGLVVIVFCFVAVTSRDFTRRIQSLIVASKKISAGDLVTPVNILRKDEVGILAENLEDMRNKLRKSYSELEQRTKELSSLLAVSESLSQLSMLSDLNSALRITLDKTLDIMEENTGGILLLSEDQVLRCVVNRGLYADDNTSCPLGAGISGRAALTGETMIVDGLAATGDMSEPHLINTGIREIASIPLRSKEKVLGVLNIASHDSRKVSEADLWLLKGVAREIAIAVENATLHQEVQRKEVIRGELLQDLLAIQEEEQKRIARELHDDTSQVLASLAANLEAAIGMLPPGSDGVNQLLRKAQTLSISILDGVHKLIYELRPSLLDDLGLVAASRWLAEKNLKEKGVNVDLKVMGRKRRLPQRLETTIFRVIQEAVNNIARHAQARNASICLHFRKSLIEVHIKDDGIGFDVNEAISSKERPRGLGLLGMKERVELVNGVLTIESGPGGGSELHLEIPLN